MTITNKAARMVAEWPTGVRFRINNVLYTKTRETGMLNEFAVMTFRNGKEKEIKLTISPSDTVSLVDFGRKS
jgi:hypothetical protein